jgi:hypothetical protein
MTKKERCWIASILAVAGLLASVLAADEASEGMPHGKPFGGLTMCVVPDRSEYTLGEDIFLTMHITNVTTNEIRTFDRFGGTYSTYKVEVLDSDLHSLPSTDLVREHDEMSRNGPPKKWLMGGSRVANRLGAGQTSLQRLLLNEWVKIDKGGVYTVRVMRRPPKEKEVSLVSNAVKIRIVLAQESASTQ